MHKIWFVESSSIFINSLRKQTSKLKIIVFFLLIFIAKEAFVQVGRQLQKRRKSDLYEMVAYYTRDERDPALEDPALKTKLEENQKQHNKKMKEVIDKYVFTENSNKKHQTNIHSNVFFPLCLGMHFIKTMEMKRCHW